MMKQARNNTKYRNFHLILFHFAIVIFLWPFLGTSVLDSLKSLYIYMLVTWLFIIGLIFVMSVKGTAASESDKDEQDSADV